MALTITQLTDKLVKQINERCITEKGKYFATFEDLCIIKLMILKQKLEKGAVK